MANTQQNRTVRIFVKTDGLVGAKQLSTALGNISKSAKGLSADLFLLRRVTAGYFGALGFQSLGRFIDDISLLRDRISILAGSQEAARNTLSQLNEIASRTKTTISGLSTVYTRVAASTNALGLSQESLLGITETLQNTFRLSGATVSEATAVSVQLTQGFSANQVRGQELRSVLEQNLFLADKLRQRFGQNVFRLAEENIITAADVIRVLSEVQDEAADKASKLGQTFGQTLALASNNLQLAFLDLNDALGLQKGFAKVVEIATEKLGLFSAALGIVATGVVGVTLATGTLTAALVALGKASLLFLLTPIGAVITAVSLLTVGLSVAFKDLKDFTTALKNIFFEITAALIDLPRFALLIFKDLATVVSSVFKGAKNDVTLFDSAISSLAKTSENLTSRIVDRSKLAPDQEKNKITPPTKVLKDAEETLKELNRRFLAGTISAREYFDTLSSAEIKKLTESFKKGTIDLGKYNLGLLEIQKRDLQRQFADARISVERFNEALTLNQLDQLNAKLQSGVVTLQEYDAEFIKIEKRFSVNGALRVGSIDYVNSIGTASQQVAEAIKNTFSSLEESIFEATKSGKLNFSDFAQSVLDDLTKIIIRTQILAPIASGFGGFFQGFFAPGGGSAGGSVPQILSPNIEQFASGGVVSGASLFSYGSSMKVGMAGEAGPEAILPLSRGPGGELGVSATQSPVNVTVINNASADVSTRETVGPGGDRVLEILIENKLREGIAKGSFDKSFNAAYGIRRRGN